MLPNLVIIGTMKGGTTSLHYYLSQHPHIAMSRLKEINFFNRDDIWARGCEWYEHWFRDGLWRGDASPNYTKLHQYPRTVERMSSVIPDARLIYVLRDPVERYLSHYLHQYAVNLDNRNLAQLVAESSPDDVYALTSRYDWQLQHYLQYYDPEQMLIITSEALKARRIETLQQVFRFLGVDENFHSSRFLEEKHPTRGKRRLNDFGAGLLYGPMFSWIGRFRARQRTLLRLLLFYPFSYPIKIPSVTTEQRAHLCDLLYPDVARLRARTGMSFSEWQL